jgi:hypothetical protein
MTKFLTTVAALAATIALSGCMTTQQSADAQRMAEIEQRQEEAACRGFMKHKASDDETTYEQCLQQSKDSKYIIDHTPYVAPQPNVTVIVGQ